MACKYKGCNESVNTPHDEELCVFHAPKDKKGITVEEFNELIWRRLNSRCFDFKGFIFPGDISFRGECKESGGPIAFAKDTDFSAAQFLGKAHFGKAQFSGNAYFEKVQFSGDANFSEAKFSGYTHFREAQFSGFANFSQAQSSEYTNFSEALFSGDANFMEARFSGFADFIEAQFSGDANFIEAQFSGYADFSQAQFSVSADFFEAKFSGYAFFINTEFKGVSKFFFTYFEKTADFSGAKFKSDVTFNSSKFNENATFIENEIYSDISFFNVTFSADTVFYFMEPKFINNGKNKKIITVSFERIRFIPFSTFFEYILFEHSSLNSKIFLIFRYCQTNDVYFTRCNLSQFSFYKSSFEKAQFISSKWDPENERILFFPFKRKNIIPEEKFLGDIRKHKYDKKYIEKLKANYEIEDLSGYEDISSLYRRMKTALDNTKDYQEASKFYFNEFEMKRKALKENIKIEKERLKKFFMRGRLLLYNIYKTFAGYGEKPLWSFIWLVIFSVIFTIWNFISGLKISINNVINDVNYNISLTVEGFSTLITGQFWYDLGNSLMFTLYRVIPVGYLPFHRSKFEPIGLDGLALSFVNSVVLILLVVFIAIGLKRHFRRF